MENKKSARVGILGDLSRSFTNRTVSPDYMDDAERRSAYGAYYGEVSLEKGADLARELRIRAGSDLFATRDRLCMVDLGTGTGDFLRGLLSGLEPAAGKKLPPQDILCVDRSFAALKDLKENWPKGNGSSSLRVEVANLPGHVRFLENLQGVDLISMANVLAENEERIPEFSHLLASLAVRMNPGGFLLLVEPADRRSSRALLTLGDQLRALLPDLQIIGPCPNVRTGSCPALLDPDNWCHEDRPTEFSSVLVKTAGVLGHVKDSLKMSYIMLKRRASSTAPTDKVHRLVSTLHREKGMSWGIFCDGNDLVRVRLLNRNRSDDTRGFSRLKRGEAIATPRFLERRTPGNDMTRGEDWPREEPLIPMFKANGALSPLGLPDDSEE